MLHKALDLAFKTQQYDALQQMTSDLDESSDPVLVEKCAEYFISNQQFDKAVDLLAVVKKVKSNTVSTRLTLKELTLSKRYIST